MASTNPTIHLGGLARRLVMDGLLDEATALDAHEKSIKKRQHFVSYLVSNKILKGSEIALSGSQEFGVPLFDLNVMDMESARHAGQRQAHPPASCTAAVQARQPALHRGFRSDQPGRGR